VGQASILGLYDDRRLQYPTRRGQRGTWAEVDKEILTALDRIRQQGGAVRLLTPTITSPTTSALIAAFLGSFKNARHVRYDPISASAVLDAHALTHGSRLLPRYRFDRADVIVSFDADFLARGFTCEYTRGYTSLRFDHGVAVQVLPCPDRVAVVTTGRTPISVCEQRRARWGISRRTLPCIWHAARERRWK
jgi:molybdopterin-containing oxidoreductase family iron-sulfur binding subunit